MRAAAGLAGKCRNPVPASAPRQASSGSAAPSVRVAEVTTSPCAGCATSATNGMPGSIQLRLTATSLSNPSMRSSANHSIVSARGGFDEIAQQPAPGGELQSGAAVEAADRRVETLPQTGLGRVVGVLEPGSQRFRHLQQRGGEPFEAVGQRQAASTSPSIGGRASACRP